MQTIGEKIVKTAFTFSARSILLKKISESEFLKNMNIYQKKKERKTN